MGLPRWLRWLKKKSACNAGDPGSIPGLRRSAGEGNGYPLQYSCLENPMDRGYKTEPLTLSLVHFHTNVMKAPFIPSPYWYMMKTGSSGVPFGTRQPRQLTTRARRISEPDNTHTRLGLKPTSQLPGCYVYAPLGWHFSSYSFPCFCFWTPVTAMKTGNFSCSLTTCLTRPRRNHKVVKQ